MLAPDYDLEADLKQRFLDALAKERRLEEDRILNGYAGGAKPGHIMHRKLIGGT